MLLVLLADGFFVFKQKTAYEMRISDWSSDVCSSDLGMTISLSRREFVILRTLMETPGVILSRSNLEEKLYGWQEEIESNTVEEIGRASCRERVCQYV